MQLPKTPRGQKFKEKICLYPGCGRTFHGIHISKYCVEHRKDRYRIRKRTKPEDVNLKNQTIQHRYTTVVEQTMNCALEQCESQFTIKIFPRQYVYPKFCQDHRNEYKRERHLRMIGREDLIEAMKADSGQIILAPLAEIEAEEEKKEKEEEKKEEDPDDIDNDAYGDDEEEIEEEEEVEEEDIASLPEDFEPTEEFDENSLEENQEDDAMV